MEITGETSTDRLESIKWLKENSVSLDTVNPQENTSDLLPLKEIIGPARLVGLGEATHGNKEFAQTKDRIFRFLVEQMHFDGIIMEVPEEPTKNIDKYVKTGKGDPRALLSGLGFWITRTQEVLDMIEWMKNFNAKSPNRQISFYGCDIALDDKRRQESSSVRDQAMAENCTRFLQESGVDSKLVLWAHNTHISNLDIPTFKTTGSCLKDELGGQYVNFGFLFGDGSFNARRQQKDNIGDIDTFTFPWTPDDSYANFFEQTGYLASITDLRLTKSIPAFKPWYDYSYTVRELGSTFDSSQPDMYSMSVDLANKYDGVIWIKKVTPSILLDIT
jgi:erythromycin esterase-like protein